MQLNTGAKIWLWLALVVNVFTLFSNYRTITLIGGVGYFILVLQLVLIAGIAVMLFARKKIGYFICCGCGIVTFILNLTLGVNILLAIWGLVAFPVITFLFLKSQWNELG